MKKRLAMVLAGLMAIGVVGCGGNSAPAAPEAAPKEEAPAEAAAEPAQEAAPEAAGDTANLDELIEAAKAEGELVVYGSCEEEYLAAACEHFQELYGVKVTYQRLSTGEVQSKIEEENGNPSGDVWFGGTTDPYNVAASEGLLEAYDAQNASHLLSDMYRDADGYWYGIYKGILGFMVNMDELQRMNVDTPADWKDLLDPKYKGLVWLSNYNTAGTAKLVINTMIQKYGHDEGIKYLVDLDKNIEVYTKSGSGPLRTLVQVSVLLVSDSFMMVSHRSLITDTATSDLSFLHQEHHSRLVQQQSSRELSIPMQLSFGLSTLLALSA